MSWLSRLDPTPSFPAYSGPYKVGTVDIEFSASSLDSPSSTPANAPETVAFRVFYPCEPTAHTRPVWWIPAPQRGYVGAYARFLGANSALSDIFAFFPQLLYYVRIPAYRNARILAPRTRTKRWPVLVFSHGLGGSRNAYSHICGLLSSHGIVVIAPDHRDGSAPISYIRASGKTSAAGKNVPYKNFPHKQTADVFDGRDEQLRIRLWELGLVYDALLKMDKSDATLHNLDPNSLGRRKHDRNEVLSMFRDQLDVHTPGAITWAGHSFGAATTVQFTKSVFWRPSDSEKAGYFPLFTPSASSAIAKQITPNSPVVLLDLWCLPLKSPSTRWLWQKPLPCYDSSGPGGTALLAVLSESFFKWSSHLQETKRVLSENPVSDSPARKKPGPRFFYPIASAHLSQSDFGILFPWVTKKVLKAEAPERTLKLNVRAILQMMRENGVEVANTSSIDMEEEQAPASGEITVKQADKAEDWKILDTTGKVKGWIALTTDLEDTARADVKDAQTPSGAVVQGELPA